MNSKLIKKKIKTKLRKGEWTSIFFAMYPAMNPVTVFARPATPKTPKEKESWIIPQNAPTQAPKISFFSTPK